MTGTKCTFPLALSAKGRDNGLMNHVQVPTPITCRHGTVSASRGNDSLCLRFDITKAQALNWSDLRAPGGMEHADRKCAACRELRHHLGLP